MKITLIQPRVKTAAEVAAQTLELMASVPQTDLMVTTEAINYPGTVDGSELLPAFSAMASAKRCYLVACMYTREAGTLRNRAHVLNREGKRIAVYDKVHLAGDEQRMMRPGDRYCVVDADFGRFGVCICWDMQFPEVCRHYALCGARLVVCPTWGWENLYAQSRAYENGIYVAGAMNVPYDRPIEGIRSPSEVIAPDGSILAAAGRDEAAALTCEIDLNAMGELYAVRMRDRRPATYGILTEQK